MAKSLQAELVAVLRRYELAGELTPKKAITNIKEYPERQLSRLISFAFERQIFYVLYDTSAGDNLQIVLDHIRLDVPDVEGELVRSAR